MKVEDLISIFKERFNELILGTSVLKDRRILIEVPPDKIKEVAEFAKKIGFKTPLSVGVVDYPSKGFQLNYYLWSSDKKIILTIRTLISRKNPTISSLTDVYDALRFHERESWEMFGVNFKGHPNLRRILLPEDWKGGFPLRKDFKPKES